jgi:hypothetical protein
MGCFSMQHPGWTVPRVFRNGQLPFLLLWYFAHRNPSGIPPGEQFDYYIPVNSSGQRGTYWVHAHSSVSFLPIPVLVIFHLKKMF